MKLRHLFSTAALCGLLAASTSAFAQTVDVQQYWTSASESKAMNAIADAYKARGGKWIDSPSADFDSAIAAATSRIAGGEPPSAVLMTPSGAMRDLAKSGQLRNFDDLATAGGWQKVMPPLVWNKLNVDGHLVGLPVVELTEGQQIGEVRDVLFAATGVFHSLLLERGGLLSAVKVLPKGNINVIGQDAITTQTRDGVVELREELQALSTLIEGHMHFVGKDVLTADGQLLGTVEDVYLDEDLNTIVGYEISEGLLVDLREGRKVMRAHPEIMIGQDTVLVPSDTELAEEF